jgi:hypothetical protein
MSRPMEDGRGTITWLLSPNGLWEHAEEKHSTSSDFWKIGVDSGGLHIFKGARDYVLPSLSPVVMCEVSEVRTEQWHYPSLAILELMGSLGCKRSAISANGTPDPEVA